MVIVAQSVEHRVVVPGVAGSSPVGHPKRAPVAQRIEQRTSDPKVVGSSPIGVVSFFHRVNIF